MVRKPLGMPNYVFNLARLIGDTNNKQTFVYFLGHDDNNTHNKRQLLRGKLKENSTLLLALRPTSPP